MEEEKEQDNTGIRLFYYNDEKYDLDRLLKRAQDSWPSFCENTIGRDYKKHRKEYDQAFENITEGLSNGTIYFDDEYDALIDTTKTYTNTYNRKSDYDAYGSVAEFYARQIKNARPYYTAEELAKKEADKKKRAWNNGKGLDALVYNRLFDITDKELPNEKDWQYLNDADNRIDIVTKAFDIDFDKEFRGLSAEKIRQLNDLKDEVIKILKTGKINANDKYTLSRLSRTFKWDNLYSDTSEERNRKQAEADAQTRQQNGLALRQKFFTDLYNGLRDSYPYDPKDKIPEYSISNIIDLNIDKDTVESNLDDNDWITTFNEMLINPNSKIEGATIKNKDYVISLVDFMVKNNMIEYRDKFGYVLPEQFNHAYYRYIYDPGTHTIKQIWEGSIRAKDAIVSGNLGSDIIFPDRDELLDIARSAGATFKKGGKFIPIAQKGIDFSKLPTDVQWYETPDEIYSWYNPDTGEFWDDTSRRIQQVLNKDNTLSQQTRTNRATNNDNPNTPEYDKIPGGKQIEKQSWWKTWTNKLISDENIARKFALDYNSFIHETNNDETANKWVKQWFNDGIVDKEHFNFDKFKSFVQNNKHVWGDMVNGIGHDFYKGRVYYVENDNGEHRFTDAIPKGWQASEKYNELEDAPLGIAYLLSAQSNPEVSSEVQNNGDVEKEKGEPVGNEPKTPTFNEKSMSMINRFLKYIQEKNPKEVSKTGIYNALGNATDIARLLTVITGNNKVAKIKYQPALHNAPRHVNIEQGNQPALDLGNQQAAQMRNPGIFNYTSDATLNALDRISREMKANDIETAAFTTDSNARIAAADKTKEVANWNYDEGIKTSNENTDLIKTAKDANDDIERTRIQKNYEAGAAALQQLRGYIDRDYAQMQSHQQEIDLAKQNAQTFAIRMKWQEELQNLDAIASEVWGGDKRDWIYKPEYIKLQTLIRNLESQDLLNASIVGSTNYSMSAVSAEQIQELRKSLAELQAKAATAEEVQEAEEEQGNNSTNNRYGGRLIKRKFF